MPLRANPSGSDQASLVSVFIADDDRQLRGLLRLLLEAEPDLEVAGEAGSGTAALEALACGEPPDVLLVDVNMPSTDARSVVRSVRLMHPLVRIVVYSGEDEETGRRRIGHDLGAFGYVVKGLPDRLLAALRNAPPPDASYEAVQRGA